MEGLSALELKRLGKKPTDSQSTSATPAGLGLKGVPSKTVFSPSSSPSYAPKEAQAIFMDAQTTIKGGFELQQPPRSPESTSPILSRGFHSRSESEGANPSSGGSFTSGRSGASPITPSEELRRSGIRRDRSISGASFSSFGSGFNSSQETSDFNLDNSPPSSAGVPSPQSRRKSFADPWTSPRLMMLTSKAQTQTQAQNEESGTSGSKIGSELKIQTSSTSGEKSMETFHSSSPVIGSTPTPSSPSKPQRTTLIFPVAPKASRSSFISDRLSLDEAHASSTDPTLIQAFETKRNALEVIKNTLGEDKWNKLQQMLTEKEREEWCDKTLLEIVGNEFDLVDHSAFDQNNQSPLDLEDEKLQILAEEGYEKRWGAFVKLCAILGVDRKDLMEAKRRAGPMQSLNVV